MKNSVSHDILLNEYGRLKDEIMHKIEQCDNLLTFTITTTVAIITLAITTSNYYLFLVPYGIIFPISLRVMHYKKGILKLSTYIIVFFEANIKELNWESYNYSFIKIDSEDKWLKLFRNSELLILSIVCLILFLFGYTHSTGSWETYVLCSVVPVFIILIECIIMIKFNSVPNEMKKYIKIWKQVKKVNGILSI